MPPIPLLQTAEISFERISAHRDHRVIEELKEIRPRMEQHAPSAPQITADPPLLSLFFDPPAILALPSFEGGEEPVTVLERPDGDDSEE